MLLLSLQQRSPAGNSTPCPRRTLPLVSSCCSTVPFSHPPPLQAGKLPVFFKPCLGIIFFFPDFFLFFFWRIIASQCYVGFYYTMKWINCMYTYIPSFLDLPPNPPPHPQAISEHRAELPVLYSSFPLAVSFTHGSVYMSLPIHPMLPIPYHTPCPHVHAPHLHLCSCPRTRFVCMILLDSTYMH